MIFPWIAVRLISFIFLLAVFEDGCHSSGVGDLSQFAQSFKYGREKPCKDIRQLSSSLDAAYQPQGLILLMFSQVVPDSSALLFLLLF